jgi:hypothetical protein
MALISTRLHGVIDYTSAAVLFGLPRAARWSPGLTRWLTGLSAFTVLYSLCTRYELGLVKLIPFRGHLALDVVDAGLLLSAPIAFAGEEDGANKIQVALGLFSLLVVALSWRNAR